MIACISPRCCECANPLHVVEPFVGGVWQQQRCPSCGLHLHVRRMAEKGNDAWLVRSVSEATRQLIGPLPPVASPKLRSRFLDACRSVARLLHPGEGVEPGMASISSEESPHG